MQTFFFYDLETSGLSARDDRIMQFAGQRTDMELKPIGEPYNVLVKLNDDTLPSPEAVMVTGITPQSTQAEGLTEAQFAKLLIEEVFVEDTIAVGFNNVRFDDEFVRHLLWRTFHDPYEWSWKDGRSRWDMLDVVRMTRALRPTGIKWPVDTDGKPVNRLELITKENGIEHANAHDALADVEALIAITKLVRTGQRKLFDYLLSMRGKKDVQKLVNLDEKKPFVYVSGRYAVEHNKATVAVPITSAPNQNVVVFDLRHDPSAFTNLSLEELKKRLFASWDERKTEGFVPIPVKVLQYNRTPAVAPLVVLEQEDGWQKLELDKSRVETHRRLLMDQPEFAEKIRTIFEQKREYKPSTDPESQLYDGFINGSDKLRVETIRSADARQLADFHPAFNDERLSELLLHYKARNVPSSLSEDETVAWEVWRAQRLNAQLPRFLQSLKRLSTEAGADDERQFLLQELQLWAEGILPADQDA